jgi:hypothetical protein
MHLYDNHLLGGLIAIVSYLYVELCIHIYIHTYREKDAGAIYGSLFQQFLLACAAEVRSRRTPVWLSLCVSGVEEQSDREMLRERISLSWSKQHQNAAPIG